MRKWGRALTLLSAIGSALVILPLYLGMQLHARADSEVGVMMYGMRFLTVLLPALPIVLLCCALWTVGLLRARKEGAPVPGWELWTLIVISCLTATIAYQFRGLYGDWLSNGFF